MDGIIREEEKRKHPETEHGKNFCKTSFPPEPGVCKVTGDLYPHL